MLSSKPTPEMRLFSRSSYVREVLKISRSKAINYQLTTLLPLMNSTDRSIAHHLSTPLLLPADRTPIHRVALTKDEAMGKVALHKAILLSSKAVAAGSASQSSSNRTQSEDIKCKADGMIDGIILRIQLAEPSPLYKSRGDDFMMIVLDVLVTQRLSFHAFESLYEREWNRISQ